MIESIIFYCLAAMAIIPALFVVTVRNVFHSALFLVLSLAAVAGLYAMMAADFLFAVQLLVYVGGIMVVLLFVILLSGKPSDWAGRQVNERAPASALFSLFFVVAVISVLSQWTLVTTPFEPKATTAHLGTLLLTEMMLPLEIISLVLVASLVGAIYFSSKKSS